MQIFNSACERGPFGVTVETSTNGEKSDLPPGPSIPVGSPVIWRYVVVNLSSGALTNMVVIDDRGVAVDCGGVTTLPVGGATTCMATDLAVAGQYANLGKVTADSIDGPVEDTDPSHYFGVADLTESDGRKVELCHRSQSEYRLIEVAVSAEPAHRSHGDARPGESVPGRPGKTFSASCTVQ